MALSLTRCNPAPSCSVDHAPDGKASAHGEPFTINFTVRQDPLSITLDGPAIFTLSTSLILILHFFEPAVVLTVLGLAPIILYIQNDYHNFLKLGPGGTPPSVLGYIRINWFRLWALRDPLQPPQDDPNVEPARGILNRNPLPHRCGPRPTVAGIAPQRQVDQPGSGECYLALRRVIESHASKHGEDIATGTSCFEKHGLGLFARFPFNATCQGEICHVHASDFSMHMSLHPEDVREVLRKGWGQRHPLATTGWLRMPVPRQFVMVYAPRTMDEVQTVCRIIEAAGYWVMAKEHHIDTLAASTALAGDV